MPTCPICGTDLLTGAPSFAPKMTNWIKVNQDGTGTEYCSREHAEQ